MQELRGAQGSTVATVLHLPGAGPAEPGRPLGCASRAPSRSFAPTMHRLGFACLLALMLGAVPALAQTPVGADPGSSVRTRADLERLLAEYEQALASPAHSEGVKRTIRVDADLIRGRLQNGNFRVGDRIVLDVQGEPTLPDTVQVEPGPMIALPLFGEISLAGVLRSEITAHLTQALSRFIRDPVVRANGNKRLSVQGSVGRPGFYTIPCRPRCSWARL